MRNEQRHSDRCRYGDCDLARLIPHSNPSSPREERHSRSASPRSSLCSPCLCTVRSAGHSAHWEPFFRCYLAFPCFASTCRRIASSAIAARVTARMGRSTMEKSIPGNACCVASAQQHVPHIHCASNAPMLGKKTDWAVRYYHPQMSQPTTRSILCVELLAPSSSITVKVTVRDIPCEPASR